MWIYMKYILEWLLSMIYFFFFKKFIYFNWRLLLYNIVMVFALHSHESAMGIHVFPILNLPPHPIPLGHPSAPAWSTLYHASNLDWRFVSHMILYVSMPFSKISPPSPSPTESKRLFYTSVSLLLSHVQGYCHHLSKFHIYVLVYCIGVFLSGLLHSV